MYYTVRTDDDIAYNVNEYVCDHVDDLNFLPHCAPGSTAVILEPGNTAMYMKNPEGKWVKL
jgi:hypothetical protein